MANDSFGSRGESLCHFSEEGEGVYCLQQSEIP